MHPPLGRPHPMCQAVIKALVECHEKHGATKFLGACNDEKIALDQCFRKEKLAKQHMNLEASRQGNKLVERILAKAKSKERAAAAAAPAAPAPAEQ